MTDSVAAQTHEEMRRERDDLQQRLTDREDGINFRDTRIAELERQLGQSADRLSNAQDRIDDQEAEIEELRSKIIDLTGQLEDAQVSPLDLAQQQRAKALTMARDVVEETGSSNILSKSGSKASLAGVLSTAHFIISGDRDYVAAEGEFVDRQQQLATIEPMSVEPVPVGGDGDD